VNTICARHHSNGDIAVIANMQLLADLILKYIKQGMSSEEAKQKAVEEIMEKEKGDGDRTH